MQFACPFCANALWDDGSLAGQEVACPNCQGRMIMPGGPPVTVVTHTHTIHRIERVGPEKSPGLAAILSFLFCGLGQVYNGEVGKGVAFLLGFWVGLALLVVPGVIVWIWSMVDAHNTAANFNRGSRRRR